VAFTDRPGGKTAARKNIPVVAPAAARLNGTAEGHSRGTSILKSRDATGEISITSVVRFLHLSLAANMFSCVDPAGNGH